MSGSDEAVPPRVRDAASAGGEQMLSSGTRVSPPQRRRRDATSTHVRWGEPSPTSWCWCGSVRIGRTCSLAAGSVRQVDTATGSSGRRWRLYRSTSVGEPCDSRMPLPAMSASTSARCRPRCSTRPPSDLKRRGLVWCATGGADGRWAPARAGVSRADQHARPAGAGKPDAPFRTRAPAASSAATRLLRHGLAGQSTSMEAQLRTQLTAGP